MKTERIPVRVTPEQNERIREKAKKLSMTVSEYLLFCALNASVAVKVGKTLTPATELEIIERQAERGFLTQEETERAIAATLKFYEGVEK